MEDMMKNKKRLSRLLKVISICIVIVVLVVIVLILNELYEKRNNIVGFWNIEYDKSYWERRSNYELLGNTIHICHNDSVIFPSVKDTINQIDYGGKNALELDDDFFTEELMEKGRNRFQRLMNDCQGSWHFMNKKRDSVYFNVPKSPFGGKYAVSFFIDSVPVNYGHPNNVKYVYKMELTNDSTYLLCHKENIGIW